MDYQIMILVLDVWTSNIEKYLYYILQNKDKIKKVIINCLNDYQYTFIGGSGKFLDDCLDLCNRLNIPLIMTSMYPEKYNIKLKDFSNYSNFKKIEWPTYWFLRTFIQMRNVNNYNSALNLDLLNNNVNLDTSFTYSFITMNNLVKFHRAQFIDLLYKHNLFEYGAISYRDAIRIDDRNKIPAGMTDSEYLLTINSSAYRFKYWKPKKLILDQPEGKNENNLQSNEIPKQACLPKEYNQSFMQVVTESDSKYFIISEKTCVPLLFNKPFLVLSCQYFHKNLKDLGFKLYDEIFDYSFDDQESLEKRTQGIIDNLLQIKDIKNKKELFFNIKEKLLYNRKLALNIIFNEIPHEIKSLSTELTNENINIDLNGFINFIKTLKIED